MRIGVVSDIHGNLVALHAVLADGADVGVERWWVLGDLVLLGSRPVEVVQRLRGLPDVAFVAGNTDRYVATNGQPPAHPDAASVVGDAGLVQRYAAVAAAVAWAQSALLHADMLAWLDELPGEQRLTLPDGTRLLGVHASPTSDDGEGIDPDVDDEGLALLLAGCAADVVVGGHTHVATDRVVDGVRALNPGSVGLPRRCEGASWMIIEADDAGVRVEHRIAPFDVDAAVADLYARRHPTAAFVEAVLRKEHAFAH